MGRLLKAPRERKERAGAALRAWVCRVRSGCVLCPPGCFSPDFLTPWKRTAFRSLRVCVYSRDSERVVPQPLEVPRRQSRLRGCGWAGQRPHGTSQGPGSRPRWCVVPVFLSRDSNWHSQGTPAPWPPTSGPAPCEWAWESSSRWPLQSASEKQLCVRFWCAVHGKQHGTWEERWTTRVSSSRICVTLHFFMWFNPSEERQGIGCRSLRENPAVFH